MQICPARGKFLRRAGQYLVANGEMSCGGRQNDLNVWTFGVGFADVVFAFLTAKIQKKWRKCKNNGLFFCFLLTYSYLWLCRKYFRSRMKEKTIFSLYFAHLFVPLQPNLYMVHSKIVHSKSSNSKLHRCLRT